METTEIAVPRRTHRTGIVPKDASLAIIDLEGRQAVRLSQNASNHGGAGRYMMKPEFVASGAS